MSYKKLSTSVFYAIVCIFRDSLVLCYEKVLVIKCFTNFFQRLAWETKRDTMKCY